MLNHQKVLKYYEHHCLQNFLFTFTSLLTALIINRHTIYCVSLDEGEFPKDYLINVATCFRAWRYGEIAEQINFFGQVLGVLQAGLSTKTCENGFY